MSKKFLTICAVMLLGGCTAIQVVTFQSSEYSFKSKGEKLTLALSGMGDLRAPGRDEPRVDIPHPDGTRIRQLCDISPPASSGQVIAPLGLAVAAVGILWDVGQAALNEYVDGKIKEFKHSYSGKINVAEFALPKGAKTNDKGKRTRCILLQREIDLNEKDGEPVPATVMTVVLYFEALSDKAYVLKPIFLDVTRAGARTSAKGHAINLDVAVGISVVKSGRRSQVAELVAIPNFTFRNISLRGDNATILDHGKKFQPSTIIPALEEITSATLSVAVVETGDGADDFAKFRKETDAVAKVLKDFGIEQLKAGLGVE